MDIKKLDKSRVEIKDKIKRKDWEKFFDEIVADFSKNTKIEGFRTGKASRKIVEQKVGKEAILNAVAKKAIQKYYPEMLKREKIEAIGIPEIKVLKIKEGNDLEYLATTAIMPELKLGKWSEEIKKINAKYRDKKMEIATDKIERELEKLANSRVKLVTVNRDAQQDDAVQVDFQVTKDGVPIEGGTAKNHSLVLGKNVFIPGFEDKIVGMKVGEESEFELTFPKEYHKKSLAGKPAKFKVKLNLIQERIVPEINDEFATSLGKFKNLSELKNSIKKGLTDEEKRKKQTDNRTEILDMLAEKVTIDLPEILIHEELHKMIHEFEAQVQGMGLTTEQYLGQMGKTLADLEKDWEPQAEKRVKSFLALKEIIKEKEVEVSGEKIEEGMNKTLQYYKNKKQLDDKIDMKRLYDFTKETLLNEEIFKILGKM